MPIYEYSCRGCGHQFEALVRPADTAPPACPTCKSLDLERLLSAPAGVTSPERNLALARAERKRWQPVHRGREYEEHQAALKEHDEHRMDAAETKKHKDDV
jgi:putative FmdB family regulatory protein